MVSLLYTSGDAYECVQGKKSVRNTHTCVKVSTEVFMSISPGVIVEGTTSALYVSCSNTPDVLDPHNIGQL